MGATELLQGLLEATVATSLATILVLGLRRPLRAAFGARTAYAAWALVPASLLAVLLPEAEAFQGHGQQQNHDGEVQQQRVHAAQGLQPERDADPAFK